MPRDDFKKTAVRLPKYLYDDLTDLSKTYGLSNNALMVLAIGKLVDSEKRQRAASDDFYKNNIFLLSEKKSVN